MCAAPFTAKHNIMIPTGVMHFLVVLDLTPAQDCKGLSHIVSIASQRALIPPPLFSPSFRLRNVCCCMRPS